jgi:hypothetical protein
MKKPRTRLPKGWDEKKLKQLISHYENQSEDEAVAEDEAAYRNTRLTMMAVPVELVPQVQKLIAKHAS